MENGWIVIGIGGATCSGKTTIANELHNKLPESDLIQQDNFYYPVGSPNLEFIEEIKHYNWDTLSSVDTDRMVEEIKTKLRTPVTGSKRILLVEGHLIYSIASIASICTLKYFMTVSKEVARIRRRTRRYKRYDERYFDYYAWPLYEKYRAEAFKEYTDFVVLDGDLEMITNETRILRDIKAIIVDDTNATARNEDHVRVLIVEGTLVLNEQRIRDLTTLKYYLTLPYEIGKERRYEKSFFYPDPPANFDLVVWPQYLKYKSQLPADANIVFIDSHENDVNVILNRILDDVSKLCLSL